MQKHLCDLLYERNCRVDAGLYRNSVSLAIAASSIPFIEKALNRAAGTLWPAGTPGSAAIVEEVVDNVFKPQNLMVRMREVACRIISILVQLENPENPRRGELMQQRYYPHARELMMIRHAGLPDAAEMEKALFNGNFEGAASHILPIILYSAVITAVAVFCFLRQMKKR